MSISWLVIILVNVHMFSAEFNMCFDAHLFSAQICGSVFTCFQHRYMWFELHLFSTEFNMCFDVHLFSAQVYGSAFNLFAALAIHALGVDLTGPGHPQREDLGRRKRAVWLQEGHLPTASLQLRPQPLWLHAVGHRL